MDKVKNKEPVFKLMGFGHRVYKNYDPRPRSSRSPPMTSSSKLGGDAAARHRPCSWRRSALKDDYFIERKLYPNVDFYTGLIYNAMGFPEKMFTVLFAMGRIPGWIAHYLEQINDPTAKIDRPRQIYTGENYREFVPRDKR